ncbi:MAG: cell division protein SepF [Candidatus Thermoplasmatota archaeon]|nr:cell division protein SepF [Candidatus Thermoplasmatota archaeon]MCL5665975.1 cell division protein SepF [Candidatus Thermoplasmatota archaeon]
MPALLKKKDNQKYSQKPREPRRFIDLYNVKISSDISLRSSVKVAEIYRYEDLLPISDLVLEGNIVIMDLNRVSNDEALMKRITDEIVAISKDHGGDAAALSREMIIITPRGVAVDRRKIRGAYLSAV